MAGGSVGRSLTETPTWAVAVVCFVILSISIFIEHIFHIIEKVCAHIFYTYLNINVRLNDLIHIHYQCNKV